ncbi:MAG TPA: cytochrome c oxidase subunit II [Kofleriaceae bacterium]|jgi:cytochrome c oxidase subunit 2
MNELLRRLLDLPPQGSTVARGIDALHFTVIGTGVVVAAIAFALLVGFLVRYRESDPRPRPRRNTRRLEIGLSAVTLAAFLAWWGVGFAQYRTLRAVPANALRVHVVAKQWMWQFVYPNGLAAETELRVPVGRPVELVLASRDAIHSFFVPAFRIKEDAVPGRVTSMWFEAVAPGEYPILCAEYCGAGHSRMRGTVIALPADEYARWIAAHPAPALAEAGAALAETHGCLRCHTTDGRPSLGPTWRGLYDGPVALTGGAHATADDAYLTEAMMDPAAKVVAGCAPIMPSYLGALDAADAAAIVEYIRSLGPPRAAAPPTACTVTP